MNNEPQERMVYNHEGGYRGKSYSTISLIALAVVLIVQLAIFFGEISLSFKAYTPAKGLAGSSWVGFKNFNEVFASLAFGKALQNTIIFNVLFSLLVFGIALIIGYLVISLPKGSIFKDMISVLCILPVFVSAEVYVSWFISLLGSKPFASPGIMRLLHPLLSAVKYAGIPVMIIYILDEIREERDGLLPLKASGLFAITSLAFIASSCFSLTKAVYNPLTYSTLDMLDTVSFRKGLLELNVGINSALGVIQVFLSIISLTVLFIPIKLLFSAAFENVKARTDMENIGQKLASSIMALIVFSVIYLLPIVIKGQPFDISSMKVPIAFPMIGCLLLSVVSAAIAAALAGIMSWSFVSLSRRIVISAAVMLALVTILTSRPANLSQYLMIRSMGLINTGFAIILATCFSAAAVWANVCILKTEENISSKSILFAMVGVFLIQAALIYCNSTPPLIYLTRADLSPVLIFSRLGLNNAVPVNAVSLYGFIISLPSLLLFLGAKIILPKRYLVSVISGGKKS